MSSCACSGSCAAPLPTEAEVRAESKYLAIRFSLAAALFVSAVVSDAVGLFPFRRTGFLCISLACGGVFGCSAGVAESPLRDSI